MSRRGWFSFFCALLFFSLGLFPARKAEGIAYQDLQSLKRSTATSTSVKMAPRLQNDGDLVDMDLNKNRYRQEFLQRLGETSTYQDSGIQAGDTGITADTGEISAQAPTIGMLKQPWWLYWKDKESGGPQPFDSQTHCGVPLMDEGGVVLSCWIGLNPTIAQHLVWSEVNEATGEVQTLSYPNWTPGKKFQLAQAVFHAHQWMKNDLENFSGTPLNDPPTNLLTLNDWNYPCNRFSKDAAWKLFVATVGHSLALEIGGWVPWSILNYSATDLDTLLNSKYFFQSGVIDCNTYDDEAHTIPKNYHFNGYTNDGRVIPTAPTTGFKFLVEKNLLRSNHLNTLTRLLQWSQPMYHYLHGYTTKNVEYYWHYRGGVPAIRVLEGTEMTDPTTNSFPGVHHWTAGCRGTTYFYRALLRNANIPVQAYKDDCLGHVMPIFWTVQKALDHGDNPYSQTWLTTPAISAQKLLISIPQFQQWFSNGVCPVGRQLAEIAVTYISNILASMYCEDLKNNLSHAQGEVFAYLSLFFTMTDLNEKQLWSRLNEKVQQLGLCTPPEYKKPGVQDSPYSSSGSLKPPP